jgi:RNA polymerase primary sigma factor
LSELGAELEIPEENRVKELLTYIQVSDDMSLDSPVRASNGEVNDTELQDFIQDPSASTEDTAFQSLLFHAVNKILQTLPERDRQVLTLRKGLNGAQQHTLQEVGDQMNLTRQRVNQIERRATKRFMEHPDAKKLRGLL